MDLFSNDFFRLSLAENHVYIKVEKPGFDIKKINSILEGFKRIKITKFIQLKDALEHGKKEFTLIGILKPNYDLLISSDDLEAHIILNMTEEEFEKEKQTIISDILLDLKNKGITYGIKGDALKFGLKSGEKILIAQGDIPKHGEDAKIKYIELPEYEPKISDDGKTDFYSVEIVKEVKKGDWLGQKDDPSEGKPGYNIKGNILNCRNGKEKLLRYDSKSVEAIRRGLKTVLIAKHDGIVEFKNAKISVSDHLIINGDVDYSTGNIEFSGSVTIKGTVQDGFKVIAGGDVLVLSEIGVGRVERIESTNGKVYIKGGISGKGKGLIKAKKNIFVKYVNDSKLKCDGDVNIGYYAIDSEIRGKNIIVDSEKGNIIGGSISAKAKIVSHNIGNKSEKPTTLNVEGFDRKKIKKELVDILNSYKENLDEIEKNCQTMSIFENNLKDNKALLKTNEYQYYQYLNDHLFEKTTILENRRNEIMKILESKGEGEIAILRKAYPKTCLEIKNIKKMIKEVGCGSFYTLNNKLYVK